MMPYTYKYPHMAVTVDLVLFDTSASRPKVLLIKRGSDPFEGMWAFPGGYVDMDVSQCSTKGTREWWDTDNH